MVVSTLSELSPRVSLAQRAISPIRFASFSILAVRRIGSFGNDAGDFDVAAAR
jgi:hypothetical protein